jgi:hypothetical protein
MFKSLVWSSLGVVLLAGFGTTVKAVHAQQPNGAMAYESHNQVDPNPLKMRKVFGVARGENGYPIQSMAVGLFTEKDHLLIAQTETDQKGEFSFASVRAGRYRLVAKHPAFCTANVPLIVESGGLGRSSKALELHMKVGGIDVCSFGSFSHVEY